MPENGVFRTLAGVLKASSPLKSLIVNMEVNILAKLADFLTYTLKNAASAPLCTLIKL